MKKSQILREVQEMIREKKQSYICYALNRVGQMHYHHSGIEIKCMQLKRWVEKLLVPYATYNSWLAARLRETKPVVYHRLIANAKTLTPFENASRAGRLAWLDWMIEQLEAKGE